MVGFDEAADRRRLGPIPPEVCIARRQSNFKWAQRYVLVEEIGVGGSSEVWKAWDAKLGRWVALKLIHGLDAEDIARFMREAMAAASISHPHIASVYEVGEFEGRHYLAMQYVEGWTLQKHPPLGRESIVRLIRDAARAIAEAHRLGIVHRDLKPANLAVARNRDGTSAEHVFVLDFGLARPIVEEQRVTVTGHIVGTPAYMPPEQARGNPVDGRADVYGLGATLYELVTGSPVFEGPSVYEVLRKVQEAEPRRPRQLDSSIPKDLENIILKCLEKNFECRYPTVLELAEDLDRYLRGELVQARPASAAALLRRTLVRRKAVVFPVAAGLLAVAVMFLLLGPRWARERGLRRAQPHLDLARLLIDQIGQFQSIPEDRSEEISRAASQSLNALDRALAEVPHHGEALYERSRVHAMVGEESLALEALTQSIEHSSAPGKALLDRALLRLMSIERLRDQTGETSSTRREVLRQEIVGDLRRAREWSREAPQMALIEGLELFCNGRYVESTQRLGTYLKSAPTDWRALRWKALAHVQVNEPGAALDCLERVMQIRPKDRESFDLRAKARRRLQNLPDVQSVVIVQNFDNEAEIGAIKGYLAEIGLKWKVLRQEDLSFERISNADLVIWNDLGFQSGGITDNDVRAFDLACRTGIPLYFIGDDLAQSVRNLSVQSERWTGLLRLKYRGSTARDSTVKFSTSRHPVVHGPYGPVATFSYSLDPDDAVPTETGELGLATVAHSTVLLANEDPKSGVRSVTQNFLVFEGSDDHGIAERRKLFMNAVSWLLASPRLIGYWPFDGDSGDASGRGKDIVLHGNGEFVDGLFGRALGFNGDPRRFASRSGDDDGFNFDGHDFTIQVWAFFAEVRNEQTLIEKFTGGGGPGWTLTKLPDNNFQFHAQSRLIFKSDAISITADCWHQVIVRRKGELFQIYFDGRVIASGITGAAIPKSSMPLLIGKRNDLDGRNFSMNGRIDEVAVWQGALSDAQIAFLYNAGKGNLVMSADPGVEAR